MICPNCKEINELTWKRYWMSPFGRHVCQCCQAKFRMAYSVKYYLAIIALSIVFGLLPFIIAIVLGAPFKFAFVIFWIFALSLGLPLDKKIDNTWRGTVLRDK